MKKSFLIMASVLLLSWMLTAPVLGQQQSSTEEQNNTTGGGEASVSQTQMDIYKQREEARQRRDELLKMRSQTIEATEQGGSSNSQQPTQ